MATWKELYHSGSSPKFNTVTLDKDGFIIKNNATTGHTNINLGLNSDEYIKIYNKNVGGTDYIPYLLFISKFNTFGTSLVFHNDNTTILPEYKAVTFGASYSNGIGGNLTWPTSSIAFSFSDNSIDQGFNIYGNGLAKYRSNLSLYYDSRSLVDKQYVDSKALSSNIYNTNGILSERRYISASEFKPLVITGIRTFGSYEGLILENRSYSGDVLLKIINSSGSADPTIGRYGANSISATQANQSNASSFSIYSLNANKNSYILLSAYGANSAGPSNYANLNIKASGITWTDGRSFHSSYTSSGIMYGGDYSANYTNRSLVDKGYVLGLTSSVINPKGSNGSVQYKNGTALSGSNKFIFSDEVGGILLKHKTNSTFGLSSTSLTGLGITRNAGGLIPGETFNHAIYIHFNATGSHGGYSRSCINSNVLIGGTSQFASHAHFSATTTDTNNNASSIVYGIRNNCTMNGPARHASYTGIDSTLTFNPGNSTPSIYLFKGLLAGTGSTKTDDAYGLYLSGITVGTNNWGIYQADTGARNVFKGPIMASGSSTINQLGIGIYSSSAALEIQRKGTNSADLDFIKITNKATGLNTRSTITFRHSYTSGILYSQDAARITIGQEKAWDGTATNRSAYYALSLLSSGSMTERFRIKNSGNVSITGSVNISGTLTAAVKSFDIPHPTKSNSRLVHGVLEGPSHDVFVRGKLINENVINLPDYWTGLVHEDSITVQLTAIGFKQDLFVADIRDNKIYVNHPEEQPSDINCFYIVHAERKDIPKLIVEPNV